MKAVRLINAIILLWGLISICSCGEEEIDIPQYEMSFSDSVVELLPTSISLNCTVGGRVTIESLRIEYSNNETMQPVKMVVLSYKSLGEYSVTLNGLEPDTKYYYRYLVYNSIQHISDDTIRSFTTPEYAGPQVETIDADGITATSARLEGRITFSVGEDVTCGFNIGKKGESMSFREASMNPPFFILDVANLEAGTDYAYQAVVNSSLGQVGKGEIEGFTTKALSPQLTILAATYLSNNSAVLNGEIDASGTDPLSEAGFCYSKQDSPALDNSTVVTVSSKQGKVSSSISNLESDTKYYYCLYAKNQNGAHYSETMSFSTSPVAVSSVSLNEEAISLELGSSEVLVATVFPADASDKTVVWSSSNPDVASVSQNGEVRALSAGSATITANASGKTDTCAVTVIVGVTSITIDQTTLSLNKGESAYLTTTVLPDDATNKTAAWSTSNSSIATVDQSGKVTGVSGGLATITAKAGSKEATCDVTVVVPVESVSLNLKSTIIDRGQSITLEATVLPADATDKTVTWISSNSNIATVDNTGKVTGVQEGSVVITARVGTKEATCSVEVEIPVTSITLESDNIVLNKGESVSLKATVLPDDASDKTVTWSTSNSSIATVDQSGMVTGKSGGLATITAKVGSKEATCDVTVVVPVESVSLNLNSTTIDRGQTITLETTVLPADATDKTVTWISSNSNIATVDNTGKVTGVQEGSVVITARVGTKEATCTVTVIVTVTSVSLDCESKTLEIGQSFTLKASVLPEDATDKSITWGSSSSTVASVDQNGLVTAVGGGSATITASAGGKEATCSVSVTVPVTGISLDRSSAIMEKGKYLKINADVIPKDATDKTVSWSSSDSGIASVDQTGYIHALELGVVNITASIGAYSATCEVTVLAEIINVQTIDVSPKNLALVEGQSYQLSANIYPPDATDQSIIWSSMDSSIATVDQDGVVTAHKKGRVTIRAIAQGNRESSCIVYALEKPSKYLTFTSSGTTKIKLYGSKQIVFYSRDLENWFYWDHSDLSITSSEPLYVCGDNKNGFTDKGSSSSDVGRFYAEGSKFSCSGDVMSLLDMNEDMTVIPCSYCFYQLFYQCNLLTSAPELPATVLKMGCYHAMFYGCTGLKASPYLPATSLADDCYYEMFYQCSSLVSTSALNATTLASHCYHGMFEFCTSLNSPPDLPATSLADHCYYCMFMGCSSLSKAPDLPATQLAPYCYYQMFNSCRALISAPDLPATQLAPYCYYSMFGGCTALISAPAILPATNLESSCYYSMFSGCQNLKSAPELPATTLVTACYRTMFQNCKSLDLVKCNAVDIGASSCTYNWMSGVSTRGSFYKSPSATSWTSGANGIPEGWQVYNY